MVKFKQMKSEKVMELDPVEIEKERMRTENGAEVAGKEKFSHKQAFNRIKVKMKKHNKGVNEKKGYYAAGWRYRAYNEKAIRKDNAFQTENAKGGEFRSIEKGTQLLENEYAQHPPIAHGFA